MLRLIQSAVAARRPRPPTSARMWAAVVEALEPRRLLSAAAAPAPAPAAPGALAAAVPVTAAQNEGSAIQGYVPAQIRSAYGIEKIRLLNGVVGDGAGQTIAIVDAYNDPNIVEDLRHFDQQFGLSDPPKFTQVNQSGGSLLPAASAAWAPEVALDVEWAHAIAPAAGVVLVEANSAALRDVLAAVDTARRLPGVSVVSMSWGAQEFAGETVLDRLFTTPTGHGGVTFVAASGDAATAAGPQWPATSPNVLAVGGTSLSSGQDSDAGEAADDTPWSGSAGGPSTFETATGGQAAAQAAGGAQATTAPRTTPDVAFDGDLATGFAIYNSVPFEGDSGWMVAGGTSAAAVQWAALVAVADQGRALQGLGSLDGATATLPLLYALDGVGFREPSGTLGELAPAPDGGYNLQTGLGVPQADQLIGALDGAAVAPVRTATDPRAGKALTRSTSWEGEIFSLRQLVHPLVQLSVSQVPAVIPLVVILPGSGPPARSGGTTSRSAPDAAVRAEARNGDPVLPGLTAGALPPSSSQAMYLAAAVAGPWRAVPPPSRVPSAAEAAEAVRRWVSIAPLVVPWLTGGRGAAAGGVSPSLPRRTGYHFARVDAAATFADALAGLINECAALPMAVAGVVPVHTASRARAWAVTIAVLAADGAVVAYLVRHHGRRRAGGRGGSSGSSGRLRLRELAVCPTTRVVVRRRVVGPPTR